MSDFQETSQMSQIKMLPKPEKPWKPERKHMTPCRYLFVYSWSWSTGIRPEINYHISYIKDVFCRYMGAFSFVLRTYQRHAAPLNFPLGCLVILKLRGFMKPAGSMAFTLILGDRCSDYLIEHHNSLMKLFLF